jgi:hypothetical protein
MCHTFRLILLDDYITNVSWKGHIDGMRCMNGKTKFSHRKDVG